MNKSEEKRKKLLEEAKELFSNKSQEEANKYFAENLMVNQITKAHMSAYINKYATSEEEKTWVKTEFKSASEKQREKQVKTIAVDKDCNPIYKIDKKTGKVIPSSKRVCSNSGEMITYFDLHSARRAFIEHFGIDVKENKFAIKEKREEKKFDEFDDIF